MGPSTPTPPPPKGPSGQQLAVKGIGPRSQLSTSTKTTKVGVIDSYASVWPLEAGGNVSNM